MIEFDPTTSMPKRIEHFTIIELLGQGAMGYVFRARDEDLKIDVALKMVKPEVAADASARERFLREARAAAALNQHDHIVPVSRVKDLVLNDGRHLLYLVMPLLNGETLQDRIRRANGKPLPIKEQRTIARHIAKGLAAAHEAGLIHRDIKPANIWLESRKDGVRAKILDFGLAKSQTDSNATTQGTLGSPAYMSPEQWKSPNVDHRADLWSFGVVLYEMATGTMPFTGDNVYVLMASVQSDTPPPVRALNPSITIDYAQLIERLLVKKHENRLATADEVIEQLRTRSAEPSSPHVATQPVVPGTDWDFVSETEPSPHAETASVIGPPLLRNRGLLIGLLLASLLLCIMITAWMVPRPPNGPTSTEVVNAKKTIPIVPKAKVTKQERPALLTGDLTKTRIEALRREWAKFYGTPLEYNEVLGNGVTLEVVFIPPGTFWMGSPEGEEYHQGDEIQHEVTISEGFYIGKHEVTQQQYEVLMGARPSYFCEGGDGAAKVNNLNTKQFPVETVSWDDTKLFMAALNAKSEQNNNKRMYRLPREAEWEYICRAGQFSRNSLPFHTESGPQNSLSSLEANFNGNFPSGGAPQHKWLERTTTVGSYKANRFGVFDMHGNLYEWCEDWYDEKYYTASPKVDPTGPGTGGLRILRGGFWGNYGRGCRTSNRGRHDPSYRSREFGFRVLAQVRR